MHTFIDSTKKNIKREEINVFLENYLPKLKGGIFAIERRN
jgi:hypothetical protein